MSLQLHEHVPERVVVADSVDFVDDLLAAVHGGAHRIHAHPDDTVAGLGAGECDATFDCPADGGDGRRVRGRDDRDRSGYCC